MSINEEIKRSAVKLLDQGKSLAELRMNARTFGHLTEELMRHPSFQKAYKVPEAMTDNASDLQVSVDAGGNTLNYNWTPRNEMRKQIEKTKVVSRMLPKSMTFNGSDAVPITLDEKVQDDQFLFRTGKLMKIINWKTGKLEMVVQDER